MIATIPVGSTPYGADVTPDGNRLYVGNQHGGTVTVINTATNTATGTISVGNIVEGVAITPDGSKAYVGIYASGSNDHISVIDTATNTVIKTIPGVPPPMVWQ